MSISTIFETNKLKISSKFVNRYWFFGLSKLYQNRLVYFEHLANEQLGKACLEYSQQREQRNSGSNKLARSTTFTFCGISCTEEGSRYCRHNGFPKISDFAVVTKGNCIEKSEKKMYKMSGNSSQ